ncbi:Scr1 family TA system antitoxin-like transcriptional regulator [Streptomyces stramineus]
MPQPLIDRGGLVLASVSHRERKLRLTGRDVQGLAALAGEWLLRGATVKELREALTDGLPERVHAPAALARDRLVRKMPETPPLGVTEPAVRALQTCEGVASGRSGRWGRRRSAGTVASMWRHDRIVAGPPPRRPNSPTEGESMPGQKKLQPGLSLAALYGKKVRKLRTQAGWTQRELGGKVYVSHSRIARIELGTESLPRQLSDALDKVLGADGDLSDLWEHIGYPLRFPSWSTPFFEAETKATRMHKFSHMMPGLTQTEGYMRALFGPYDIYSGLTTEEKVSTRLGRQAILDSATPPWLWIILDEAVLYRIVGGQEVMRGQLTQLLALTERPRFHLQILPYASSEPCTVGAP